MQTKPSPDHSGERLASSVAKQSEAQEWNDSGTTASGFCLVRALSKGNVAVKYLSTLQIKIKKTL